jgi:hypothetical protein
VRRHYSKFDPAKAAKAMMPLFCPVLILGVTLGFFFPPNTAASPKLVVFAPKIFRATNLQRIGRYSGDGAARGQPGYL